METETVTGAEITFSLRVSSELNEKLCAQAAEQKRSRQAQIVFLLEKSFDRQNGKKEKAK